MGKLRTVIPEPAETASPVGIIEKSGKAHYTGDWDVIPFQDALKGTCVAAVFCRDKGKYAVICGGVTVFLKKY